MIVRKAMEDYDDQSHFYIDGVDSYPLSVRDEGCIITLLKYTEENRHGTYYSIQKKR